MSIGLDRFVAHAEKGHRRDVEYASDCTTASNLSTRLVGKQTNKPANSCNMMLCCVSCVLQPTLAAYNDVGESRLTLLILNCLVKWDWRLADIKDDRSWWLIYRRLQIRTISAYFNLNVNLLSFRLRRRKESEFCSRTETLTIVSVFWKNFPQNDNESFNHNNKTPDDDCMLIVQPRVKDLRPTYPFICISFLMYSQMWKHTVKHSSNRVCES